MEAAAPSAKKRRSEARDTDLSLPPATASPAETPRPEATTTKKTGQEPPPHGAGGEEGSSRGGVDRISVLPDAILCDIISLLPTKDGARTQVLASRWAHLWRSAPLNLDCRGLPAGDEVLTGVVSRILSSHPGPGRRLCVPAEYLLDRGATVDAWLRSPALARLQEIDMGYRRQSRRVQRTLLPASTFRLSATLRVATICRCYIVPYGPGQTFHLPQLKQLTLVRVGISDGSLHSLLSGCPALEILLLDDSFGFPSVRINSNSLRSIGVRAESSSGAPDLRLQQLVIEGAPCLERLLCADGIGTKLDVSVKAAPKLETLGSLSVRFGSSQHVFGSTAFQGLHLVSFTTVVHNVKILAAHSLRFDLDMAIDLMKCFPCLEKLYIKGAISGERNLWRRKHREFIRCFGIRLKTVVLEGYRGTKPQINLASFFVQNAKELEVMRLKVGSNECNEEFFAEQQMMLHMEERASRGSRLEFATDTCRCQLLHIRHLRDLSTSDPFECTCGSLRASVDP